MTTEFPGTIGSTIGESTPHWPSGVLPPEGSPNVLIMTGTLLIDGEPAGVLETDQIFWLMISWSGLDVGFDRGTTVAGYDRSGRHMGPFAFTGELTKVTVDLADDQIIDHEAEAEAQLARE